MAELQNITNEKRPIQLDLELCEDTPCWRFQREAAICVNCPWVNKIKEV